VFERSDVWHFSAPDAARLAEAAREYWLGAGYVWDVLSQTRFRARRSSAAFYVIRTLKVSIEPAVSGADMRLDFHLAWDTSEGALPARPRPGRRRHALVKTPWQICEDDWAEERRAFWNHLLFRVGARPAGTRVETAHGLPGPHRDGTFVPLAPPPWVAAGAPAGPGAGSR
jgi:hypothetical protein